MSYTRDREIHAGPGAIAAIDAVSPLRRRIAAVKEARGAQRAKALGALPLRTVAGTKILGGLHYFQPPPSWTPPHRTTTVSGPRLPIGVRPPLLYPARYPSPKPPGPTLPGTTGTVMPSGGSTGPSALPPPTTTSTGTSVTDTGTASSGGSSGGSGGSGGGSTGGGGSGGGYGPDTGASSGGAPIDPSSLTPPDVPTDGGSSIPSITTTSLIGLGIVGVLVWAFIRSGDD